jgi:hypothetical protein
MYTRYEKRSEAQVDALLSVKGAVPFKDSYGNRCRMGANGSKACSIYNYSKWFNWTSAQRRAFKDAFPEKVVAKAVIGHFLEIPAGTGFLDLMNYWVDKFMAGKIITVSLQDNQTFLINGNPLVLNRGDTIGFSLRELHEIKPSEAGQLWACIMVRGDLESLK